MGAGAGGSTRSARQLPRSLSAIDKGGNLEPRTLTRGCVDSAPHKRVGEARNDHEGEVDTAERVKLAKELYREYHTRCFWHCPRDLDITEDLIPFVVKGLRNHGGRRGFVMASLLLP